MNNIYNKLINEKSPYLLQHAQNPVNWNPWNDEVFEKAQNRNIPVFLSIGYATCHWCHVMEHESFEDNEVAKLLNDSFICIKVDREERPDIDSIYMKACQIMTGTGGWPLTLILTPQKKPFFAATYIPKFSRFGKPGLIDLLPKIITTWNNHQQKIIESAENMTNLINQVQQDQNGHIKTQIVDSAVKQLNQIYDPVFGGFGSSPKFPCPHNLLFLLHNYFYTKDNNTLLIIENTLYKMRLGGIYDQIGFGFHRYSTDNKWFLPHFEKMLYDQASLSYIYLEAYQATKNPFYANVAKEIFSYVSRDMTSQDGAFYSAEDADSEGEEGKYYTWSYNELKTILSESEFKIFLQLYDITEYGNYCEESTGKNMKSNILFLNDLWPEDKKNQIELIRKKILSHRYKRVRPLKDTKILTDWNALMIASFAKGARVLNSDKYKNIAIKAAQFIFNKMFKHDFKLMHRYKDGDIAIHAKLDDYSFLVHALLELYETTFDVLYLEKALELCDFALNHFWDSKNGGFYFTSDFDEQLIVRPKEAYDAAIPSGNSFFLLNLIKIFKITGNVNYEKYAENLMKAFSQKVNKSPISLTQMLIGLQFIFNTSFEIVISGEKKLSQTKEIIKKLNNIYLPNKVVLFKDNSCSEKLNNIAPYVTNQNMINGKTALYICKGNYCKNPVTVDEIGSNPNLLYDSIFTQE